MGSKGMVWKSIGAVLAGFLANVVATTVVDIVLHLLKVFPPMGQPLDDGTSAIATSYRVVFGVLGCYLTARLAPANPMKHALAQGLLGVVLCAVAIVVTWNKNLGPHWYPIALAVIALPCAWLGGIFYKRKKRDDDLKEG